MATHKRNLVLTTASTALELQTNQLRAVKEHRFAVTGGNVTVTYTIGTQSFTVTATPGQHVLEMSDIDSMSFASASTSNLTYLAD